MLFSISINKVLSLRPPSLSLYIYIYKYIYIYIIYIYIYIIYIYIYVYELPDRIRGQPEGSLFNSYYTKV